MKPFANGLPKSGNHALAKACQSLGIPTEGHHVPFYEGVPNDTTHHIFIKRDPRNVLISELRFRKALVCDASIIALMSDFYGDTFVNTLAKYEPYLTHPNTLVISFEGLTTDGGNTIKKIAEYCDVEYQQEAYDNLYGGTMTWSGKLSDYREYWTPAVKEAWKLIGGDVLLECWGYVDFVPQPRTEITPQGLNTRMFELIAKQVLTRGADIAHETALFTSGTFIVDSYDKRCGCKHKTNIQSPTSMQFKKGIAYDVTCVSDGQMFLIENVLYKPNL